MTQTESFCDHIFILIALLLFRPGQIIPLNGRFSDLPHLLFNQGIQPGSVDAFLFDAGASSMQFDTKERGFSLAKDGPLDMRMDPGRYSD